MTGSSDSLELRVSPNPSVLASTAASELVFALRDLTSAGDAPVHLVLTGGTMGNSMLHEVAECHAVGTDLGVDWDRVHFWWGDERFVPVGDTDRNDAQSAGRMLEVLHVPESRVHRMPAAPDHEGADDDTVAAMTAGAESYAAELDEHAPVREDGTRFDLLLLGVGPDGHVASLFPGHPAQDLPGTVVPVTDSPKPPPLRISMTMHTLNQARAVWFIASGEEKAELLARAYAGADPHELPAGAVHGLDSTVWWLDAAAASRIDTASGEHSPRG